MKLMNTLSDESVLAKCESLGFDNVQSEDCVLGPYYVND